ncbi:sugar phosphate isomerase/epimerase, partial [Mesorhizobium sp. M0955]
MHGFGVHTSMWTMNWDRAGAEKAIAASVKYGMDFIEIALLNAPAVDAAHTRALLEKHNLPAVCSLGLPERAWASVRPDAAIEHLEVAIDKTAEMGALALSGVIFGGIGER